MHYKFQALSNPLFMATDKTCSNLEIVSTLNTTKPKPKIKAPPPIILTSKLSNLFSENEKFCSHLQGNLRVMYSYEGIKYLCENERNYIKLINIFKANNYEFYFDTSDSKRPMIVLLLTSLKQKFQKN